MTSIRRRAFLRGMGAFVAVPPLSALARTASATTAPATTASGSPLRLVFVGVPNGVNLEHWRPTGTGRDFQLGRSFAPLEKHDLKGKIQIFTGFAQRNADARGDGPGDHARANAAFLTGCHPRKTAGSNIQNGVSIDQVAADRLRGSTRLPSLELISIKTRRSGSCDSGYSCAYEYNLAWASPTMPMPAESDPRQVFERLFGAGPPAQRQRAYLARQRQRRSLLDFVREDARSMQLSLGATDRRKLDEYLGGLREVERQIEAAERYKLPRTGRAAPAGPPEDFAAQIRLLSDLLVLALQSDSTRVATFLLANEGNNRSFSELGIPEGHHHLSHHQRKPESLEKVARIDRFYMERLAHLLRRLDAARDPDGASVLDNTILLYGGAISDGDKHNHDDLPIVLAGRGGGRLTPGRHVSLGREVPLNNLFLTLLDQMGTPVGSLGDSTGRFEDV